MRFRFGGKSDVGRLREVNEDDYRIDAERGLVAVADGLGGSASGRPAATIACETAVSVVALADDGPRWPFPPDPLRSLDENLLVTAGHLANLRIAERARVDRRLTGMGAAAVFARFDADADRVALAYVGDVQVFRWRRGTLTELLRIHSLINDLGSFVVSAEEEARYAELPRNVVTRIFGVGDFAQSDVASYAVDPDDVYVLATDGLHGDVEPPEIARIVAATAADPQRTATALVDAANESRGSDNITVVAVACG
jgi:serine/threonine protein phosphatase PrpC